MLKATLIICLFLSPNLTYSQSNQAWIDSVLTKVILNEIAIFDEHLKLIKSSEITLITTDTVVNCVWTRQLLQNTVWANSQIVSNSKQIDLDSCHKAYRLVLNENSSFEQYYGNFRFLKYYNKLQGHYLDVAQGVWVIEEDYLKLVDLNTKKVLTFSIEKLSNTELHLKAAKLDYLIKMKKAN